MSSLDARPLAPPMAPGRARALPWLTVAGGSLASALPGVAVLPTLPPPGLLMLLAWRLLARFSLRPWAPALLGLFDDLLSGQPLGSAALAWSLCYLVVDRVDDGVAVRTFVQDWALAAVLIVGALVLGRWLASPPDADLALPLAAQAAASVLLFPAAAALVGLIDRRRNYA